MDKIPAIGIVETLYIHIGLPPKFFMLQDFAGQQLRIFIGVSKNSGTPKWMVYNAKPYY